MSTLLSQAIKNIKDEGRGYILVGMRDSISSHIGCIAFYDKTKKPGLDIRDETLSPELYDALRKKVQEHLSEEYSERDMIRALNIYLECNKNIVFLDVSQNGVDSFYDIPADIISLDDLDKNFRVDSFYSYLSSSKDEKSQKNN